MHIKIQGTNIDVSDTIRDYVEKRLGSLDKVLAHYDDGTVMAEVEVEKALPGQQSGEVYRAEVNISVPGNLFRADETHADLYAAIDLVKDKLFRELRSHKNKKTTLWRRAGARLKRLMRRGGS